MHQLGANPAPVSEVQSATPALMKGQNLPPVRCRTCTSLKAGRSQIDASESMFSGFRLTPKESIERVNRKSQFNSHPHSLQNVDSVEVQNLPLKVEADLFKEEGDMSSLSRCGRCSAALRSRPRGSRLRYAPAVHILVLAVPLIIQTGD